jgi:hypothetical protein
MDNPGKTAIARKTASEPLRWLLRHWPDLFDGHTFDYGCGKGADVRALQGKGHTVSGWDLFNMPDGIGEYFEGSELQRFKRGFDTVLLTYVLNVVTPETQADILKKVMTIAKLGAAIVVTVRRDIPKAGTQTQRWVELNYGRWKSIRKTSTCETYILRND